MAVAAVSCAEKQRWSMKQMFRKISIVSATLILLRCFITAYIIRLVSTSIFNSEYNAFLITVREQYLGENGYSLRKSRIKLAHMWPPHQDIWIYLLYTVGVYCLLKYCLTAEELLMAWMYGSSSMTDVVAKQRSSDQMHYGSTVDWKLTVVLQAVVTVAVGCFSSLGTIHMQRINYGHPLIILTNIIHSVISVAVVQLFALSNCWQSVFTVQQKVKSD